MRKPELNPKIWKLLKDKTYKKMTEQAIRNALSRIRRSKPFLTLNAAAEIFAQEKGFSVARYLNERDRETLRSIEIIKIKVPPSTTLRKRKKLVKIAHYETDDKWLKSHIEEINKTYTHGCYTATFVLCRKVLENLITHHILKKKYPSNKEEHRKKYFYFDRKRFHDFEVLLKNLRASSKDFGTERKLVERICQLAGRFKETANEMAHSLYHIATKKEIDENSFQSILDLIKELEETL